MKAKIDLEKFICSWLKARQYCSDNECGYVVAALREQGLDYKDGEIVEIEQKNPFNKERLMEVAKPETQEEKAEAEEREDLRKRYERIGKSDWFKKTHEGIIITGEPIGTDMDGGVVGEMGEQGTNKNFKERYENIAKSDWFKKTHKDISIGEEQPTEEEMVGMGELGNAWFEKELLDHIDDVARRLHPMYSLLGHFLTDYNKKTDKIISILQSAILPIPRETYVPPIIKNPLDPDPNTLGGWETTASTEGGGE